jgi:hypothetical protein
LYIGHCIASSLLHAGISRHGTIYYQRTALNCHGGFICIRPATFVNIYRRIYGKQETLSGNPYSCFRKKFIKKNPHIIHSNQHKIISQFSGRYFFADYSETKKRGFLFSENPPGKKTVTC